MQKNDIARVTIEDMSVEGDGIGKSDGYALFIKDAVIGDVCDVKVIKAKKNFGYAKLLRVAIPSPYRVTPACRFAKSCGGCQLQQLSYERQLKFKENKIKESLRHVGEFSREFIERVTGPVAGMENPFHYRNKALLPFGTDRDGNPITGFYAARTHDIIANTDCMLVPPVNRHILEIILEHMKRYKIASYDERTGRGLMRHALIRHGFKTKEIMVCLMINGGAVPRADSLIKKLSAVRGMTGILYSKNTKNTNVIMGEPCKVLWGRGYITDYIKELKFRISPSSFFQVNPAQTEKLYDLVLEYAALAGNETVWDLYCGIGTISLFLAKAARQVYGVEIVHSAVADAKINAEINGIGNAGFFEGKAEEILPAYYSLHPREKADVIVVDPPRKGCDAALLDTIANIAPKRVIYVSCDPATLARDLKILCGKGYRIEKVRGVDEFPMAVHVETVVLLSKLNAKQHIEVEIKMDELDLSAAESKATYDEIKAYVLEHTGLKVSSLYISQVKRECGLDVGQNYNLSKKEDVKVPQCPSEKEAAITEALKYFNI